MEISIAQLINLKTNEVHETKSSYRSGHLPLRGALAYLHTIYKPAYSGFSINPDYFTVIPNAWKNFLNIQNGALLFSRSICLYGVLPPVDVVKSLGGKFEMPYDILSENSRLESSISRRNFVIGGYGYDGTVICLDRINSAISLLRRSDYKKIGEWSSFLVWLSEEIERLTQLFEMYEDGLVPEAETVPFCGLKM